MRKLSTLVLGMVILCIQLTNLNAQNLPFPQNVNYDYGLMPSNANSQDAQNAYNTWKNNFVTSCGNGKYRVRWDQPSQTVSEGIGYGMLLAAYAGDKTVFDGLWNYYQSFTNQNGVMHWKIDGCNGVVGQNGATDAELDAAMALIVADKQWGSSGSVNYEQDAKNLIAIIKQHEVENGSYVLKPGDMFGGSNITNPSYYSPAYYRVYGQYTNDQTFWNNVAAQSYTVINNNLNAHNAVGGLVSDWTKANGSYVDVNWYYEGGRRYHYDAARTPWRIATDYVWFGTSAAATYSKKSSDFVRVNLGGIQNVRDGYLQNGSQYGQYHNSTFVGPFASAAMGGQDQNHLNASYSDLVGINDANSYYNQTLKALTLFLLTGNFYNPLEGNSGGTNLDPSVTIVSPADSTIFSENEGVAIEVSATDSDGSISKVEFYEEGTLLYQTVSAPYEFLYSGNVGTHTIEVVATDNDGAESNAFVTITIKEEVNQAPSVTIVSPADSTIFSENEGVAIEVSATDSDGSISKVEFYEEGTLLYQTVSSPYEFLYSGNVGTHTIEVVATDNEGAESNAFVTIIIEEENQPNAAPTISVTTDKLVYTEGDVVSILATASDSDGEIVMVEFYNGNQKLTSDNSSPYSYTLSTLSAGTYTLNATATDDDGAVTTSSEVSITVEEVEQPNASPTISITTDNLVYTEGDNVTILAYTSDSDGSVSLVEFYNGSQKLGESNSAPYSYTWSNVSSGSYSITAVATDNEGATTTSSAVSITVETSGGNPEECTTEAVPNASQWVVRNDWADQNNGSQTSASSSEMEVVHRPWGRGFLWLINTQAINVVSGENYTISFDFKGDPAIATQSIEVGLANGITWNGPTSMAIDEMEVNGNPSATYSTLEVSFTATYTGTAQVAIRFDWGSQVSQQVDMAIKNLNFCSSTNVANNSRLGVAGEDSQINIYPNPFVNNATLLIESSNELKAEVTISDASGKIVKVINGFTNQNIHVQVDQPGVYFIQVKYGTEVFTTKLMKQ